MNPFAEYPALAVEAGAAYILIAALAARILMRRFGVPSIVTLLIFGLLSGPSGVGFMNLNLTQPATRALLSLAVVVVLFEATLRMEVHHISKRVLLSLAVIGPATALWIVPIVAHAFGLTPIVGIMTAAICVVTGPTVTGPLLARLRLRSKLSHLLETEGLALDALGVIIAAAIFASFTTRPGGTEATTWHVVVRIGIGLLIGAGVGWLGRTTMPLAGRLPSDISKIYLLLLGLGTYALAEAASHESGLTAVVVCGFLVDFSKLPHERLVRSFKEDLSMLALSTVFVLLASQIRLADMRPLVAAGAAITGVLVGLRIIAVLIATVKSGYSWRERVFMMTIFPRGIVAVSLATYYATQLPAWGIRGSATLAGTAFLVIIFTVALSTASAIVFARLFKLAMPAIVVLGISSGTLEIARKLLASGYVIVLADDEERRVAFGRSNDFDAELVDSEPRVRELLRAHNASILILAREHRWPALSATALPKNVRRLSLGDAEALAAG
jgi:NhaP-type Na+/H+ or K+/H+ antiporter